jgi:plastocyanin
MRRFLLALTAAVLVAAGIVPAMAGPAGRSASSPPPWAARATSTIWHRLGDPSYPAPQVPTPTNRMAAWAPQPPGTRQTVNLDFGPYVVGPGSDLSRIEFTPAGATGYSVEMHTYVLNPDGSQMEGDAVHTHHVHLLQLDPSSSDSFRWLYGTGEEMTGGSIDDRAKADPAYSRGLRYGVPIQQGQQLGILSMLHNETSQPHVVYIRFALEFVYGTHAELAQTKHWDMHALQPAIFGGTFNVPRTGASYAWPKDLPRVAQTAQNKGSETGNPTPARIVPGVGVEWVSPWTGTIVVTAGHLHAGGTDAVLSNLGSRSHPCPSTDRGMPGSTLLLSHEYGHHGASPTNDYQMGTSQNTWRAYVHKGDVLLANGVYQAKSLAFPDAMVFYGVYVDPAAPPPAGKGCTAWLRGNPRASHATVTRSVLNHPWSMFPDQPVCSTCDRREPLPEPGSATGRIEMVGMQYLPGNGGTSGQPAGPPTVAQGQPLVFDNEDYAAGLMRHTATACAAPCNGSETANYPMDNGQFDSGVLGYMWEDAYVSTTPTPTWTLDTSRMRPGFYTFFCRLHPFMRGSFYVTPKQATTRSAVLSWWRSLRLQ